MQAVRRTRTEPEEALAKALWRAGVRGFRRNDRRLAGSPDFAFSRYRVAVFVDGGFWHGHPAKLGQKPLPEYWARKIGRNMARDREVDEGLANIGWTAIRIWDLQISRDVLACVRLVEEALSTAGRDRS